MSIFISLPPEKNPSRLADWIELNTMIELKNVVSCQAFLLLLQKELEGPDDQIGQSKQEVIVGDVFNELKRRAQASGKGYPFVVDSEKIFNKKVGGQYFLPYKFCLLLSYYGVNNPAFSSNWKTHNTTKKFEELSALATKILLHNKQVPAAVKIFSSKQSGSKSFPVRLQEICVACCEMTTRERERAKTANDGGVDIIAWKSFPDRFKGGLLFWGQCAAGDNWTEKLHDTEKFKYFVDDRTKEVTALFIPHIPDVSTKLKREEWDSRVFRAGMLINRCRISYLVNDWEDGWSKVVCEDTVKKIRRNYIKDFQKILK